MEPTWVGSPTDIRYGEEALQALNDINDKKYWCDGRGAIKIDAERWLRAQEYEEATWLTHGLYVESDRNHEHHAGFASYRCLPDDLGDLLEIGCGPFTQTITILAGRTARTVTLLDPLLTQYQQHPNCRYKTGSLINNQTELLPIPAEQLNRNGTFDTVICINVLEHVFDAELVLANLFMALRTGGYLILAERSYESYTNSYDVGHPVRIGKAILDKFKSRFRTVFENGIYFVGLKS